MPVALHSNLPQNKALKAAMDSQHPISRIIRAPFSPLKDVLVHVERISD